MPKEGNASFLSHTAYVHIQEQLIQGRWGLNERISEKTIADELGISRTPVREAIRKMVAEDLLYQVPSSGTFVTNPDRQTIGELFEVRLALEGLCAERAAEKIRAPEVRELQRQFVIMRNAARSFRDSSASLMSDEVLERFLQADRAMHNLIMSVADNRMASNIVHSGRIQALIYGLKSYARDLHHIAATLLAHGRILAAIKQRDGASARGWMETHILNSMADALRSYDRQMQAADKNPEMRPKRTD